MGRACDEAFQEILLLILLIAGTYYFFCCLAMEFFLDYKYYLPAVNRPVILYSALKTEYKSIVQKEREENPKTLKQDEV